MEMTEEELNKIEATVREHATLGDIDPEPSLSLIALARLGLAAAAEITRLRARLDEAAKILALFAEEAVRYEPDEGDGDDTLWDKTGCLRIKHLRAAAQWMKENKP